MKMISEKEKEEIRQEAKALLEKFAKALDKVKFKEKDLKSGIGGFREEGEGEEAEEDFRKTMFENFRIKDSDSVQESENHQDSRHSPETKGDSIIAEKKKW